MSGEPNKLSCQEFREQMADLVGSGADVNQHPHLQSCEDCRALLSDLQTIADAARKLLPVEEQPQDDLWDRIQLAIQREEGLEPKN